VFRARSTSGVNHGDRRRVPQNLQCGNNPLYPTGWASLYGYLSVVQVVCIYDAMQLKLARNCMKIGLLIALSSGKLTRATRARIEVKHVVNNAVYNLFDLGRYRLSP